jgi:hypothetical protein
MKPYGFDGVKHITDDYDMAGCVIQGAPSKHGLRQSPHSKASSRRAFKRAHRAKIRREIAAEIEASK